MKETTKVAYWCGKDVDTLSKEELLEALNWCCREIDRIHEQHHKDPSYLVPYNAWSIGWKR